MRDRHYASDKSTQYHLSHTITITTNPEFYFISVHRNSGAEKHVQNKTKAGTAANSVMTSDSAATAALLPLPSQQQNCKERRGRNH
jgi:hypothetical protein